MSSRPPPTEDVETYHVPVPSIVRRWNPFGAWIEKAISVHEVMEAVQTERLDQRPHDTLSMQDIDTPDKERAYHIERIAWLVVNPDPAPIIIFVGCPSLGVHPRFGTFTLLDGNHRLAAAFVRGSPYIEVAYDGECAQFRRVFPRSIPARLAGRSAA